MFLVSVCMFLILTGVFAFSLAPVYFLSITKDKIQTDRLLALKNKSDPTSDPALDEIINKTNLKLNSLNLSSTPPSNAFDFIVSQRPLYIKINEISFKQKDKSKNKNNAIATISISGTASSRDALLSFKSILESNTSYSAIDLPVSNLVKNSNIPFIFTFDFFNKK